jgi:hypothetical protein
LILPGDIDWIKTIRSEADQQDLESGWQTFSELKKGSQATKCWEPLL